MIKIKWTGKRRDCDVIVGTHILSKIPSHLKAWPSKKVFVISDSRLSAPRTVVKRAFERTGWTVFEIKVRAGESLKNFRSIYPIYGQLLKNGATRDSLIVALGGGSIGDAVGFIAATYLRGVSWVGIPTTLLAQVDSCVGGKTGVNHELGKNLIGAFHQPVAVICDTAVLKTLSNREFVSGLGEAIKYGFIYDPKILRLIEKTLGSKLKFRFPELNKIVTSSLKWKSKVVQKDEFDTTGQREVLNFGHTFGHALENVTGYKRYQHGEAVIWGMRFALALSVVRKKMAMPLYKKLDLILKNIPVPALPKGSPQNYFRAMRKDKKIKQGRIHFVLLQRPGKTVSDSRVSDLDLKGAWRMLIK